MMYVKDSGVAYGVSTQQIKRAIVEGRLEEFVERRLQETE